MDVLTYFKEMNANIICLQDTHWIEKDIPSIKRLWGNDCFINGARSNARGVAILFKNNFEFEILAQIFDPEANFICLTVKTTSAVFNIATLYGPDIDNPSFYSEIKKVTLENNPEYYIICGDFNMTLDPDIDSFNYSQSTY